MKKVYLDCSIRDNLGLVKGADAKALQKMASDIDLTRTSLLVKFLDGKRNLYTTPSPVAVSCTDNKEIRVHGVEVQHVVSIAGIELNLASFTVPHLILKQDKNHLVYRVVLYSVSQLAAMHKHGGLNDNEYLKPLENDGSLNSLAGGKDVCYIGKTSAGMFNRYKQHILSALKNPHTVFHKYWYGNQEEHLFASIKVIGQANTSSEAYDMEEATILRYSRNTNIQLLNTASSRDAIKELLEKYPHLKNERINPEQAEELRLMLAGKTAENWNDPLYAEKVICNNPNNLDAWQVRQIRCMHSLGVSNKEAADTVGCSVDAAKRVIARETYGRIQ